jgi:hypothetical protein
LSGTPNTYVIGVNPVSSSFEQVNPDGSVINYESSGSGDFTGGTVTGETLFEGGLSASTISGGTLFGDGSNLTGVGTGAFSGGVVTGFSNFTNGLSSTSISATTISGNEVLGDGSNLVGVVALSYAELGFTVTVTGGTLNQNVALPYSSSVTYNGPLNVAYTITIPEGTSLDVLP